ncbi:MAG TPA: class I SAM-dependent methyltransferase [Tepidisphaeraceae bacterium]|nr:class I SAM-dependent methyltransferase [Tepidisphaeraceae bacterium]
MSIAITTPAERWTQSASRYDRPHLRLRQVATIVNEYAPARLLDVGCSAGHLRLLCPGIEYHGIDFAAAGAQTEFAFTRCDINREPLPDHLRDLPMIVCCGALEYVERLDRFLPALRERLAPGGRLLATYYNMNHLSRLWAMLRGRSFWVHPDWRGFHSPARVRELIESSGFEVERVQPTWHSAAPSPRIEQTVDLPLIFPRWNPLSALLSHQFIYVARRAFPNKSSS